MIDQQVFSAENLPKDLEKSIEKNQENFNDNTDEYDNLDEDRQGNIYVSKHIGGEYGDRLIIVGHASLNNKIHTYIAASIGQYGTFDKYFLVSVSQLETAIQENQVKLALTNKNECVLK